MDASSKVAVQVTASGSFEFSAQEIEAIRRHHSGLLAAGGTVSDALADDCHSVFIESRDGRAITYGKQDGRYFATGDVETREVLGVADTLAQLLSVVPPMAVAA